MTIYINFDVKSIVSVIVLYYNARVNHCNTIHTYINTVHSFGYIEISPLSTTAPRCGKPRKRMKRSRDYNAEES